jgi:hypothetical protein
MATSILCIHSTNACFHFHRCGVLTVVDCCYRCHCSIYYVRGGRHAMRYDVWRVAGLWRMVLLAVVRDERRR